MPSEELVCVSEEELNPQVHDEHDIHHAIEGDPEICFLHAGNCQQPRRVSQRYTWSCNVLGRYVSGCCFVISSFQPSTGTCTSPLGNTI